MTAEKAGSSDREEMDKGDTCHSKNHLSGKKGLTKEHLRMTDEDSLRAAYEEHPVARLNPQQKDPKPNKALQTRTSKKPVITASHPRRDPESAARQDEVANGLKETNFVYKVDKMIGSGGFGQVDQGTYVQTEKERALHVIHKNNMAHLQVTNETTVLRFDKMMGSGGFGKVYQGTHVQTGEEYALKIILKKNITNIHALSQVRNEIIVLKKVHRHPNIVAFHSVVDTPKIAIAIVMELGVQDLQQFCANSQDKVAALNLKEVALGILEPLSYLHSNGIAHMDLKPENVIVFVKVDHPCHLDRRHIKLCDFGLCRDANKSVCIHNCWVGTLGFFAPEMLREEWIPEIADMWSFGCTMMKVSPGFPGHDWLESYKSCRNDYDGFKEGLSKCLDTIHDVARSTNEAYGHFIKNLLCTDPSKRLRAQKALENDWLAPYGREVTLASSQVLTDPPPKRRRF